MNSSKTPGSSPSNRPAAELEARIEEALGLHQAGQLGPAEAIYREVLEREPDHPQALHLSGVVSLQMGRPDDAVGLMERALAVNPDDAEARNNLGQAYESLERTGDAVAAYREAIRLAPGFTPALANLGHALLERGETEEAVDCFVGALKTFADDPDVLGGLGKALAATGRPDEAVAHLRRARDIAPEDPAVLCNLGTALQAKGDLAEAEAAFEAAVALDPGFAEGHYNLGVFLQDQGRLDEATDAYGRALEIDPTHNMAHVNLGKALQDQGKVDDAVASYRRALEAVPEHAEAYHNLSLLKTFEAGDADLAAMEALRARPGLDREQAMFLDFALAKALDELGEPDRAFPFMASGNRLKRAMVDFDFAREESLVEGVIGVFDKALLERRGAEGLADPTPIFILGMPRSGTTLVEQILASHSQVFGAGELKHLRDVVTGRGGAGPGVGGLSGGRVFPEGFADLDAGALRRLGEAYVALLRGEDAAARITDKMPGNFLYLGLIYLTLPEARIVHCVRNPVDTCLSCYQILFSGGQNFSYDLGELGRYYRLYARLMDHWRRVLPGRILDVRYEELVAEPEAGMRALVGLCGLDWEDACLRFHDSDRPIRTASAQQVRRPIYKTAVARWRRYEKHLGPLVEALGPLAKDG